MFINQAKQIDKFENFEKIINLLLLDRFYPVISYRRVQRERRRKLLHAVRYGHSLRSAISCQRKWLTPPFIHREHHARERVLQNQLVQWRVDNREPMTDCDFRANSSRRYGAAFQRGRHRKLTATVAR